jgi:hypothetical protein
MDPTGFATVRVDAWASNGIHKLAYLKQTSDGLELTGTATVSTGSGPAEGELTDLMIRELRHHGFEPPRIE